jgi:N-methylhydantoinase A
MAMTWRLGFDIGGTFTDFALQHVETGAVLAGKCLTTPEDPARGVFAGLTALLSQVGIGLSDVVQAVHGTTLGANLVIERKGAKTCLVTTHGFRDILEIQRQLRYNINDFFLDKHPPLIPRDQVFEVRERVLADGVEHVPLDEAEVDAVLRRCAEQGIESLAIAFLHSYANPAHEERVGKLTHAVLSGIPVSLSSSVSPQYREYERTNTTVVNAYITPRFARYLDAIQTGLTERGFGRRLYVMQNNGGIAGVEIIVRFPVRSLDSGPTAGAILAAHIATMVGERDLIAFDMGGTTAKACLIENGRPVRTDRLEIDMVAMRPGSGLPISVPSADLVEIGAGGGSIARVDRGILRVGPESAGSDPGPACYGLGGAEPTVTDADLVLGYLDAGYFLGGARRLDLDAARRAIHDRIAKPLGVGLVDAAWGVHQLVTVNMEAAIRVVSIGRGKDPRQLACVTFGGAGPVHGARLARQLGIRRMVVPFAAGVGSAIGLLIADARFDVARTLVVRLDRAPWDRVNQLFDEMEQEGMAHLRESGLQGEWRVRRSAEVRYLGQGHELDVELPSGPLTAAQLPGIERAHAEVYAAHYGYAEPLGKPIEATNWKLEMLCVSPKVDLAPRASQSGLAPARKGARPAYVAEGGGFVDCPVYDRYRLGPDAELIGPAIVEERETTVILLPNDRGSVDRYGNLIVELAAGRA